MPIDKGRLRTFPHSFFSVSLISVIMENLRKVFNDIEYIEQWKDIIDYEGLYKVSTFGRVKSLDRVTSRGYNRVGIILKQNKKRNGYMQVILCRDGSRKDKLVHRLSAIAFVPNPDNLPEVNHKDEIKDNNFYLNFEWMTRRSNQNHTVNKNASSKYAGVIKAGHCDMWIAKCHFNGVRHYLGLFKTEINAAQAYICFCAIHNLK